MRIRIRILVSLKLTKSRVFTFFLSKIGKRKNIPTKVQKPFGKAGNGFIVNFRKLLDPDPHSSTDPDPGRIQNTDTR
jgi:hypothetical protein